GGHGPRDVAAASPPHRDRARRRGEPPAGRLAHGWSARHPGRADRRVHRAVHGRAHRPAPVESEGVSDSRLARMFGDAIAAPVRVASLLRDSAAALDDVTGDAARDAAALALAATERTALSSAEAISAVAGHLGSSADREGTATVAVSIPDAPPSKERDAAAADPGDRTGRSGAAAHVHVRDGGRTA